MEWRLNNSHVAMLSIECDRIRVETKRKEQVVIKTLHVFSPYQSSHEYTKHQRQKHNNYNRKRPEKSHGKEHEPKGTSLIKESGIACEWNHKQQECWCNKNSDSSSSTLFQAKTKTRERDSKNKRLLTRQRVRKREANMKGNIETLGKQTKGISR